MKKSARFLALALAAVMLLALCACGGGGDTQTSTPPASTTPAETTPAETDATGETGGEMSALDQLLAMEDKLPLGGLQPAHLDSRADIDKALPVDKTNDDQIVIGWAGASQGSTFFTQMYETAQEKCDEYGYELRYQNANFDDNQATQIGQMFSAEDVDLMVGIATNAAVACFNAAEDKDIPVIFTAITDPVGAHLDEGNITGTSDALPVAGQLELIRALQPDADTIGIVYTTSEANSVYSISVYEELAADYGFTIDAVGVTSQAEVTQAVDTLLSHGVDCLSNLTDNNVVGVLGAILEKTDEAGIPVYGSEVEQVKLGCVGGAGLDYVQLGIQTGLMAAKVLTGEASCQDLPYETIENYGLYVNSDTAAKLGITIPDDIAQQAEECAE